MHALNARQNPILANHFGDAMVLEKALNTARKSTRTQI